MLALKYDTMIFEEMERLVELCSLFLHCALGSVFVIR